MLIVSDQISAGMEKNSNAHSYPNIDINLSASESSVELSIADSSKDNLSRSKLIASDGVKGGRSSCNSDTDVEYDLSNVLCEPTVTESDSRALCVDQYKFTSKTIAVEPCKESSFPSKDKMSVLSLEKENNQSSALLKNTKTSSGAPTDENGKLSFRIKPGKFLNQNFWFEQSEQESDCEKPVLLPKSKNASEESRNELRPPECNKLDLVCEAPTKALPKISVVHPLPPPSTSSHQNSHFLEEVGTDVHSDAETEEVDSNIHRNKEPKKGPGLPYSKPIPCAASFPQKASSAPNSSNRVEAKKIDLPFPLLNKVTLLPHSLLANRGMAAPPPRPSKPKSQAPVIAVKPTVNVSLAPSKGPTLQPKTGDCIELAHANQPYPFVGLERNQVSFFQSRKFYLFIVSSTK